MKITRISSPSLAELATKVVRLGRELEQMAHAVGLDCGSPTGAPVRAMLQGLAARSAFGSQDVMGLAALGSLIASELATEVTDTRREFFPTYQDEHFEDGEVRECPVYSTRGQDLLRLHSIVTEFIKAREAVLDRVAAERALSDLLGRE
jgi:hypothetical protein